MPNYPVNMNTNSDERELLLADRPGDCGARGAQPPAAVRNDLPQPYRTTRDWGELPEGMKWPAVTAIETGARRVDLRHRALLRELVRRAQ